MPKGCRVDVRIIKGRLPSWRETDSSVRKGRTGKGLRDHHYHGGAGQLSVIVRVHNKKSHQQCGDTTAKEVTVFKVKELFLKIRFLRLAVEHYVAS